MPESSRDSDSPSEKRSHSKNQSPESGRRSKSEGRDTEPKKDQGQSNKDQKNKDQKTDDNQEKRGSVTERSNKKESYTPRGGRKKQKEYFKEELKRLKDSLEKEAAKIVEPEKKEFTPNIFNSLEPYYNTDTPHFLIETLGTDKITPDQIRHGYVSRQTALDLCDPWIDLQMDIELLPKIESKIPKSGTNKKKSTGTPRTTEGSTRLPKFPAVYVSTDDLTKNKTLYYSNVPNIREELKKKYSLDADEKMAEEYKRTKQDFYRMELDKLDEYHPSSKPKMKAAYFAYLQNNPGSKKAIHECIREVEDGEKRGDKQDETKPGNETKTRTGEHPKESRKKTEQKQPDKKPTKSDEKKVEKKRGPSPDKPGNKSPDKQRDESPEKQRESPEKQRDSSPSKSVSSPDKRSTPDKGASSPDKQKDVSEKGSVRESNRSEHSSSKN